MFFNNAFLLDTTIMNIECKKELSIAKKAAKEAGKFLLRDHYFSSLLWREFLQEYCLEQKHMDERKMAVRNGMQSIESPKLLLLLPLSMAKILES